jgi:hypothetical protein
MNDILDRIKKLLRLSRSANQHEAALALSRARQLAAKHRIDLSKVDADESNTVTHKCSKGWQRVPLEGQLAAAIVGRFFRVKIIYNQGWNKETIVIVGTRSDVEIALYVFDFLVGHFRRAWNKRTNRRLRRRDAFIRGMYNGLYFKLLDTEEPQTEGEAAIVSSFDTYIAEYFGLLTKEEVKTKRRPGADASRFAGYQAGLSTDIHPAIRKETPALKSKN